MPRHDVFDDGEPEAGAVLGAALSRVDAIEALGQSRQMFRRDAAAEIPDGEKALFGVLSDSDFDRRRRRFRTDCRI